MRREGRGSKMDGQRAGAEVGGQWAKEALSPVLMKNTFIFNDEQNIQLQQGVCVRVCVWEQQKMCWRLLFIFQICMSACVREGERELRILSFMEARLF